MTMPRTLEELDALVTRLRDQGTDSLNIEAKGSSRALPKSVRQIALPRHHRDAPCFEFSRLPHSLPLEHPDPLTLV